MVKKFEGSLMYNMDTERYGLKVNGEWVNDGFHCGDHLEVMYDGRWTEARMEIDWTENGKYWYLVGTEYYGALGYIRARW